LLGRCLAENRDIFSKKSSEKSIAFVTWRGDGSDSFSQNLQGYSIYFFSIYSQLLE